LKKNLKILILTVIIFFTTYWSLSVLKCEYLTFMHKKEFARIEEVNHSSMIKVLDYDNNYAKLYCVNFIGYNSNIYTFRKENGEWVYDDWEDTVWAKYGTAESFMWPYGK